MSFVFDLTQRNAIEDRLLAARSNHDYTPVYEYIFEQITDNFETSSAAPKVNVDPSVWIWVRGAKDVNADKGHFSDFI